ncbi:hypothetical protein F5882DRAFT_383604 [Hyaloscypha sp. PMI_1271]|nr:hypothetical protein F5882DRAFT_383604 [Hyaloscypha sp. PMI_1271]
MDRLLGPRPKTVDAHDRGLSAMTVANFVASPAPLNLELLKFYDLVDDRQTVHNGGDLGRGLYHTSTGCDTYSCQSTIAANLIGSHHCFRKRCCGGHSLHGQGTRELTSHGVREGRQRVLAGFQAAQDKKILDLGLESAQSAWRAADWELQSLDETMTRLQYYQGLVNGGLNSGASGHQLEAQTAMQSQNATVAIWPKSNLIQIKIQQIKSQKLAA